MSKALRFVSHNLVTCMEKRKQRHQIITSVPIPDEILKMNVTAIVWLSSIAGNSTFITQQLAGNFPPPSISLPSSAHFNEQLKETFLPRDITSFLPPSYKRKCNEEIKGDGPLIWSTDSLMQLTFPFSPFLIPSDYSEVIHMKLQYKMRMMRLEVMWNFS